MVLEWKEKTSLTENKAMKMLNDSMRICRIERAIQLKSNLRSLDIKTGTGKMTGVSVEWMRGGPVSWDLIHLRAGEQQHLQHSDAPRTALAAKSPRLPCGVWQRLLGAASHTAMGSLPAAAHCRWEHKDIKGFPASLPPQCHSKTNKQKIKAKEVFEVG